MQLDEKKNSLASIFLKILCLFVAKTYQILFVQFGMYVLCVKRKVQWLFTYQNGKFEVWYVFCFGRKDKFDINTYHILIIHFGMYKEKNLTEFCLNFTYQILFAQFGMYICVQRGKFIDFLHTKMENLKFGM